MRAYGFPEVSGAEISQVIGPPLDQAFRALLPDLDDSDVRLLVAKYRERYAESGYAENTMYEGIPDALGQLAARRVPLGLCTSKRVDFAERILEMFGLRKYFEFVDGGDIGISKTEQLRALLEAGRIGTGAVMIGDRAVDMDAAHANGLGSVGVLWGYGPRGELVGARAGRLLERVAELAKLADGSRVGGA